MLTGNHLTITVSFAQASGQLRVTAWDNDAAARSIASSLENPSEPSLADFLKEAGFQDWFIEATNDHQVVLKKISKVE